MTSQPSQIVVIGSGLSGFGVVRELRKLAPEARITVVTRDDGHFYSKPAISTAMAKQKTPDGLVTMSADKMRLTQKIEIMARTEVHHINPVAHTVTTPNAIIPYDRLVLATGAQPVRPVFSGTAASDYFCVNTLDDYERFRRALKPDARVGIIGAGLIGCEFANDLSHAGHKVIVIDPLATPLAKLIPAPVGVALRDALEAQGISWHLGSGVTAIDRVGHVYTLTLTDTQMITVDLVLVATGLRPDMALARAAGLNTDRGIVVDNHGRTSDPDIFALGDCAQYPHGLSAYVTPIMTAARSVAASVVGTPQAMAFPPLSVQVKTTACPLVLLPPPEDAVGEWQGEAASDGALKYCFHAPDAGIIGYAMTGRFCDLRADLDRTISLSKVLEHAAH